MSDAADNWTSGDEPRRERRFDDQIHDLVRREPFEPFVIAMASGDRLHVTHDLALSAGPVPFTVYLPGGGIARLRKKQIVGIEIPEPAS